jgi:uncharacterized protein involved in exopolysaccharide biosynthesis
MRKLLEAFFRHKWLVLLPPLVIPLLVAPIAYMTMPVAYESVVGVWVDRATYLDPRAQNLPFNTSAAQTQSSQLTELLHTRSFMIDVVQRTSLAPLLSTKAGEGRVADMLDKGVTVTAVPNGTHLLAIRARFTTPQVAYQVAQAIVDAYTDRNANLLVDQSTSAIGFFQSQLDNTQDASAKASRDLSQYALAMGYASSGDGTPLSSDVQSVSAFDPEFADLQAKAHFAQQQVDQARVALQNAQQSSAAAAQGADVGFQVIDPPQMPTAPVTQLKNVIVFIVAALIIGLGLSTIVLVFLVATDRSIRTENDLVPPVRVLGTLPMLKVKQRLPKAVRASATRRAIGFVAGSALPAPRGTR